MQEEEEEEVEEVAEEAAATAKMSEADLRQIIEKSNEAATEALSAAQVALWAEVIATMGTLAGVLASWVGWKMDDSQLPEELQVPSGDSLPPELKQPPPEAARMISSAREAAAVLAAASAAQGAAGSQ